MTSKPKQIFRAEWNYDRQRWEIVMSKSIIRDLIQEYAHAEGVFIQAKDSILLMPADSGSQIKDECTHFIFEPAQEA